MKKILRFIKNNSIGFIAGLVIAGSIGVYAVSVASSDVSYDNSNSGSEATTVSEAIDDLYTKTNSCSDGSGAFYYLGRGTSFNVKSMYPWIDPSQLTIDNFIIGADSAARISAQAKVGSLYNQTSASYSAFSISKSYNPSTGALTLGGNGYSIKACLSDSYSYCSNAYAGGAVSPFVYLNINSSKFIDLGAGTSFDIKSSYPNVDYASLTTDNFIVGTMAASSLSGTSLNSAHQYLSTYMSGFTLSKSYNNTTGVLSVGGNGYSFCACNDDSYKYCCDVNRSGSVTPHAYLILP